MAYYINEEIANAIIYEIKNILEYHINIIDINGIIIASTDYERVGSFHEGANNLIKNKKDILIITPDSKLEGVKEGINLPIKLKEDIIGVIGITGAVDEILPYGKIIQKLIEVFLLKNYNQEQFRINEIKREAFVKKWLAKKFSMPKEQFETELKKYKLRKSESYTVVLFSFQSEDENKDTLLHKYFDIINIHVERTQNIVITHKYMIMLISSLNENELSSLSDKLIELVRKLTGCKMFCGIGDGVDYLNLNSSFSQAKKALSLSKKKMCKVAYSNSIVYLAIDSIDQKIKSDLKKKFLKNITPKEEIDIKEFVKIYSKNNGSIQSIADYENIHKNTVQYRISKIKETLNMDIRDVDDFFILYLISLIETSD